MKARGKVADIQKVWLSSKEAKAYLGCSDDFLRTLRESGEIRFAKYGPRACWYEIESIDRFMRRHMIVN